MEFVPASATTPSVALNKTSTTIGVSGEETLTADVKNAEDATVIWTSSAENVATVDSSGKVTGIAEGEATITASIIVDSQEYSGTCAVTVVGSMVAVTSVTVAPTTYTMAEGATATIAETFTTTVEPSNATDPSVSWFVTDGNDVITLSEGVITAAKAGTATLTATAGTESADVTITVTAKPKVWVGYNELKTAMGDLSAYTVSSGDPSSCSWVATDNYGGSDSATYAIKGNSKSKPSVIKLNSDGKSATFTPDMDGTLTLVLGGTQHAESIAISNATGSPFAGQEGCQEITFPVTSGTEYKIEGKANIFIHAAVLRPEGTPACTHTSYGAAKDLTAATCGDNKTTIKWCDDPICFHSVVEEVANSATGAHAAYEWKTVTAATDDADGERAYVCKVCGAAGTAPDGESTVIPKLSHTATVTATNGTVTLSGDDVTDNGDGTYKIKNGSTVTVTATPGDGYEGGAVTVDGTALAGATFTMPERDVAVAATFTAKVPEITLSKDTVEVKVGANTTVTVTVTNGTIGGVSALTNNGDNGGSASATYNSNTGVITITGVAKGTATVTVSLTGAADKTIAVTVKGVDEHAHHYEVDEAASVASTCSTKGKKVEKCTSNDGVTCDAATKETELALDPTNHEGPIADKDGTAKAPTCGVAGKEADKACQACGVVTQTGAAIAATGAHTFKDADGKDLEKCSVCNAANPDYVSDAKWDLDYTATEAMASGATVESVEGIKLTMGCAFTWYAANAAGTSGEETLSAEAGMAGVLKGSGGGPSDKDAVPADGKSYLKFDATKDGTLTVAYAVFGDNTKTIRVLDSTGAAVADAGKTGFKGNGDSTFDVKAGGTYYVFAGGANIGFYGFSFTADEGGEPNPPAPETKTITFSIGDGTQVTDIKVDGVAATLTGGKLTDIAKAAVVTFQAAVTDATKTLKVTGATFADGVYTVTADTVSVTAVASGEEPGPGPDDPTAPTTGVFTLDVDQEVAAGKLTVAELAANAEGVGTDGLFTIMKHPTGSGALIEATKGVDFGEGYTATNCFKSGGGTTVNPAKPEIGRTITFTTGAESTVKVWWTSGSNGCTLVLKDKDGQDIFAETEGHDSGSTPIITTIENVPAGVCYLGGAKTVRIYKIVVAVGDSTIPGPGPDVPGPGPDVPGPGPDDPGTDPADTAALTAAITAADKLAGAYTVRPDTTVVSNVNSGSKYVLQKDKDALVAAIAAAKAVAAKEDATQDEVDKAVADLAAAMDAFNAAVKTGTKTGSTSSGGGSSVRGDRGESPVTSTTTVTTADGLKVTIDKSSDGGVSITAVNADGEVVAKVALPATIPSVGYKFVDVPDEHWAAKAINDMAGLGMVKGVDEVNHIFDMNSNITRGAVATIIYRMANGKSGMTNIFDDVAADVWYTDGIAWANKAGVVNGFEDGTFRPDGNITREQLAVMIARFAKIIGLDTSNTGSLISFKDSTKVQAWAVDGVSWCVANGIINGRGDGTIDPAANATRAEAAAMLDRFIQLLK